MKQRKEQQQDMKRDQSTKDHNTAWANVDVNDIDTAGRGDVDEGMATDEDMKK